MRWQYIGDIIGILLIFLGVVMVFPLGCSFIYHDDSLMAILMSMAATLCAGTLLFFASRRPDIEYINPRGGIAIVALGWAAIGMFGALPFYLGDAVPSFTDAVFESVSGFTTTGSSVLTNIDRKSTRLNSSHLCASRMPSSA